MAFKDCVKIQWAWLCFSGMYKMTFIVTAEGKEAEPETPRGEVGVCVHTKGREVILLGLVGTVLIL